MLCVSLPKKFRIIHSPRSFPAIIYNVGWGSGGVGGGGGGVGVGGWLPGAYYKYLSMRNDAPYVSLSFR